MKRQRKRQRQRQRQRKRQRLRRRQRQRLRKRLRAARPSPPAPDSSAYTCEPEEHGRQPAQKQEQGGDFVGRRQVEAPERFDAGGRLARFCAGAPEALRAIDTTARGALTQLQKGRLTVSPRLSS